MMNKDFARILTFLRKEKKLSQKQAAQELGVSQALLSHYEKGIRECGLDFVVKAADYYHVSCDYLLGRTTARDYDLNDSAADKVSHRQSAVQNISRRLIGSTLNTLFDLTAAAKNRRLDRTAANYMIIALYRLFRRVYSVNKENPRELFTIPESMYELLTEAAMSKYYADLMSMTEAEGDDYLNALGRLHISAETLAEDYPDSAGEIFNIIQQAENAITKSR